MTLPTKYRRERLMPSDHRIYMMPTHMLHCSGPNDSQDHRGRRSDIFADDPAGKQRKIECILKDQKACAIRGERVLEKF